MGEGLPVPWGVHRAARQQQELHEPLAVQRSVTDSVIASKAAVACKIPLNYIELTRWRR
jgi:hypothetical protein